MGSPTPEVLGLLGLSRRAGALATGTEAVRDAIRRGRARLVVTAGDASATQLEKIRSTLRDRAIPQASLGDRNTLGAAVGMPPLTAVAVTDASFAIRLIRELGRTGSQGSSDEVEA